MRLTVLGCNGPYPGANGACSGYLLEENNTRLLLDCGSGVLAHLTALTEPEALSAVFLSHLHFDHCSDMLPLSYRCDALGKRLAVYLPAQDAPLREILTRLPAFDARDIAAGAQWGALRVEALPVRHPAPGYALRITGARGASVCYTGDTNTCAGLADFARGCDLLLADACFPDALWNERLPHMSAREAARLASEAQAGQLLLTHFRPDIARETLLDQAREAYPRAILARPGLTISV